MKDESLTKMIIGCAFRVHNALGPGFLEKVYENALCIELLKKGLEVKQQEPIEVSTTMARLWGAYTLICGWRIES